MSTLLAQFKTVAVSRNLRRLELAYGASITSEWAFTVALAVFAYQHGGARSVALLGVVRMLPAAVATPFTSAVADRFERERALVGVSLLSAVALAASAGLYYAGQSVAAIFAFAAAHAVVSTLCRPAVAALAPSLAATPQQLVAVNGVSLTVEGVGTLVGPLIAGAVVATADAGVVFVFGAIAYVVSALALAAIRVEGRLRFGRDADSTDVTAGIRLVAREPQLRLVVLLFGAQSLVRGALNVFIAVIAFRLLGAGGGWVGILSGAVGAGVLLGGFASVALTGRRLALPFAVGLLLWGIPIALVAAAPYRATALLLLIAVGVGNAVEDVAGLALLQRLASDELLGRVFGVLFGVATAGFGLGAIMVPVLISAFGVRGALIATGALLPVLVGLSWSKLRRLDAAATVPTEELAVLDAVPMFAPLPLAAKERLAKSLVPLHVASGQKVLAEGEASDRFYIVGSGHLRVTQSGRRLRDLQPGDSFGEIGLLRDVPRTATVTAADEVDLYALGRAAFIDAATGHSAARAAGEAVVHERLGHTVHPAS